MCVIQVGVRAKFTYVIEGVFVTERIKESLNTQMSCL